MSKRRRGSRQAPPRKHNMTQPVRGRTTARSGPGVPWLAAGGVAIVVLVIGALILGTGAFGIGAAAPSATPSAAAVASAAPSVAAAAGSPVTVATCPTK